MHGLGGLAIRTALLLAGLVLILLLLNPSFAPTGQTQGTTAKPLASMPTAKALGPLKVDPDNPRYFTNGSKAVYLTGSHTWSSLQDAGSSNRPPVFYFDAYLNFLQANNHNFIRLWAWEQSRWTLETRNNDYWFNPGPSFLRTGPGYADDGEPKYNVSQFNQAYFDRLRARVIEAGNRGIYVSIMLFNGWSVANRKGSFSANNPWRGHPFKASNNINGINGDPDGNSSGDETHTLLLPEVTAIQEAYVRKTIDTVNDLDNVLYEVSNESHADATPWQYHMISYIKSYEAGKLKQHPVGMTAEWPNGSNVDLFASPADWISPNGDINNPLAADGSKVILSDTDHLCGICGDHKWVWKSFTRGENPIFMDGYDGAANGLGSAGFDGSDPTWASLRLNLGYALSYANRMNLVAMTPRGDLASSGYCLANPATSGAEYLVYLPSGGTVTVNLKDALGMLSVEWFNPATGVITIGGTTTGGSNRSFTAPFSGDAVLYIYH